MKRKREKVKPEKKIKLLPTLRERRHYLVIKSEKDLDEKEFHEIVNKAILNFIGILGYAKAGPIFVETGKDYCILSITTKYVNQVKAALALQSLSCVGVSGTIKKARRFL